MDQNLTSQQSESKQLSGDLLSAGTGDVTDANLSSTKANQEEISNSIDKAFPSQDENKENQSANKVDENGLKKEDEKKAAENESDGKSDEDDDEPDDPEWFDLLNNKEIRKRTIRAPEEGAPRPERGCRCDIRLITRVQETGELVSSETFDTLSVFVGEYDVIPGVDLSLPLMHVGEQAQIIIRPRFGYGTKGKLPEIPSDCVLDCEVELLKISWPEELEEKDAQYILDTCIRKKEKGNFWYGREEYSSAIVNYKKTLELLDIVDSRASASQGKPDEALINQVVELRFAVNNNLTLAHIKTQSFNLALDAVDAALQFKPTNVKALYRKATILKEKGEVEAAIETLQKAGSNSNMSKEVTALLNELRQKHRIELQNERQLYRRMLRTDANEDDDDSQATTITTTTESTSNRSSPASSSKSSSKKKQASKRLQDEQTKILYKLVGSCVGFALLTMIGYYVIFN